MMALTQPGAVSDDEHGERCVATRGLAGAWGRGPGAILLQSLSSQIVLSQNQTDAGRIQAYTHLPALRSAATLEE